MTTTEKIRLACAKNGTTIKQIERDCGISNGTIARIKDDKLPMEKINAIAKRLNVEISEIIGDNSSISNVFSPPVDEIRRLAEAIHPREEYTGPISQTVPEADDEEIEDCYSIAWMLLELCPRDRALIKRQIALLKEYRDRLNTSI